MVSLPRFTIRSVPLIASLCISVGCMVTFSTKQHIYWKIPLGMVTIGAGLTLFLIKNLRILNLQPRKMFTEEQLVKKFSYLSSSCANGDAASKEHAAHQVFVGLRHLSEIAIVRKEPQQTQSKHLPPLSIFYPTAIPPRHPIPWLPFEDLRHAEGLAQHSGIPSILFSHLRHITMNVTRNASADIILDLSSNLLTADPGNCSQEQDNTDVQKGKKDDDDDDRKKKSSEKESKKQRVILPIVVFSHGLAGWLQLYSLLAMELAARGIIVICVQHLDGSASFARKSAEDPEDCVPMSPLPGKESTYAKDVRREEDFDKKGKEEQEKSPGGKEVPKGVSVEVQFRTEQLAHRVQEMKMVMEWIESGGVVEYLQLNEKRPAGSEDSPSPPYAEDLLEYVPSIHLVGHSFGASTVFSTAWRNACEVVLERKTSGMHLSFGGGIHSVHCLDLWHIPLHSTLAHMRQQLGKQQEDEEGEQMKRLRQRLPYLQLLDSQEWERWKPNRNVEEEVLSLWHHDASNTAHTMPSSTDARKRNNSEEKERGEEFSNLSDRSVKLCTDHRSASDPGVLFPSIGRRKYHKGDDGVYIAEWANEIAASVFEVTRKKVFHRVKTFQPFGKCPVEF